MSFFRREKMDLKENTKRFLAKIDDFWHNLSVKKKFQTIGIALFIIVIAIAGSIVKTNIDNSKLSPQMLEFKKNGTLFLELPEKVNENNNHIVHIKGQVAPKSRVQIGFGIFGDTTTADATGSFQLTYDDNIQQNTNIKITTKYNNKQMSKIVTVVPSPERLHTIEQKNKRTKQYKKEAVAVKKMSLKTKSFTEAKSSIQGISSSIVVTSKSNDNEVTEVSDTDIVTDVKVKQTNNGVSVELYLEPSDSAKKTLADKKASEQKSKDLEAAKNKYKENVKAYEVRFNDYAIEYLIDKNTSTIYETTTDDHSISQSKFTGSIDEKISFNLDGLEMTAFNHYVGNDSVAIFNDSSGNSNKASEMNPETTKSAYFKSLNLPF